MRTARPGAWLLLLTQLGLAAPAAADEGFWTFDRVPVARIEAATGVRLTPDWLDRARRAALRIPGQCSAGFVSPRGLVMTNYHCLETCIGQNAAEGAAFVARAPAAEARCPGLELNQLLDIVDVTERIGKAAADLAGAARAAAIEEAASKISGDCETADTLRCEVIASYEGEVRQLYRYRRFRDVRLVMAPERGAAYFGGAVDDFAYPRHAFDVAFARVYEDGRPLDSSGHHFRWSEAAPGAGDPVFVVGSPGPTTRLWTHAQLAFERDVRLPRELLFNAELKGYLEQAARRGSDADRPFEAAAGSLREQVRTEIHKHRALTDTALLAGKLAAEAALRAGADAAASAAWGEIEQAMERHRRFHDRYVMLENPARGFRSTLFPIARDLVRLSEERTKPDDERLGEYVEARLPGLRRSLLRPVAIAEDYEIAMLAFSLERLHEEFGNDAAFVDAVFGPRTPRDLAAHLVRGSKLKDPALRRALLDGGRAAVAASDDALVAFVRDILDPRAREARRRYETEVEAPLRANGRLIARALVGDERRDRYPDGTLTLRLSYGRIAGLAGDGNQPPFTTIGGAFERSTGRDPFELPASWLAARGSLAPATPYNVVSTNDVTHGFSGSPALNRDGEIVGVVFDHNLPALGSVYGYDAETFRAITLTAAATAEILAKVYDAAPLVAELRGGP